MNILEMLEQTGILGALGIIFIFFMLILMAARIPSDDDETQAVAVTGSKLDSGAEKPAVIAAITAAVNKYQTDNQ
jgi:hypothetical protein